MTRPVGYRTVVRHPFCLVIELSAWLGALATVVVMPKSWQRAGQSNTLFLSANSVCMFLCVSLPVHARAISITWPPVQWRCEFLNSDNKHSGPPDRLSIAASASRRTFCFVQRKASTDLEVISLCRHHMAVSQWVMTESHAFDLATRLSVRYNLYQKMVNRHPVARVALR